MNEEIIIKATADIEVIKHRIYEVRGLRVMLDRDLAELYGGDTHFEPSGETQCRQISRGLYVSTV